METITSLRSIPFPPSINANEYITEYRVEWIDARIQKRAAEFRSYNDMQAAFLYLKEGKDVNGDELTDCMRQAEEVHCFKQKKDRAARLVLHSEEISRWTIGESIANQRRLF